MENISRMNLTIGGLRGARQIAEGRMPRLFRINPSGLIGIREIGIRSDIAGNINGICDALGIKGLNNMASKRNLMRRLGISDDLKTIDLEILRASVNKANATNASSPLSLIKIRERSGKDLALRVVERIADVEFPAVKVVEAMKNAETYAEKKLIALISLMKLRANPALVLERAVALADQLGTEDQTMVRWFFSDVAKEFLAHKEAVDRDNFVDEAMRTIEVNASKKELTVGLRSFYSLIPGCDPKKIGTSFDRELGEYFYFKSRGDTTKAEEIRKALCDSLQSLSSKKNAERFLEMIDSVKETNAFDQDRINFKFPLVVVFDGAAYKEFEGKRKPYVHVYVKGNGFEAITAVYGNKKLPKYIVAKGGLRLYLYSLKELKKVSGRMLREATRLGLAMDEKNPYGFVPYDGGKTIIIMTDADADKATVISDWVRATTKAGVLGNLYIAGPDMNVNEADMDLLSKVYWETIKKFNLSGLFPTTGGSSKNGGFPHKEWMVTGVGVAEALFVYLSMLAPEDRKKVRDVTIQGFGDVGISLVSLINKYNKTLGGNLRIVGISNSRAAAVDKNGLDMESLEKMGKEGKSVADYPKDKFSPDGKFLENVDDLLLIPTDIFMPAAKAEVITADNINDLNIRWAVVEGSNNAVAMDKDKTLHKMRITFIPGVAANGGGIFTSTMENIINYYVGTENVIKNSAKYRIQITSNVRELLFASTRALLRESAKNKVSPSEQHARWTRRIRKEVYKLTGLIDELRGGKLPTRKYGEDTKDALVEILRRIEAGQDRIPDKLAIKFAIMATVRGMLANKELYKINDVLAELSSNDEDARREAAYILGQMKVNSPEVIKALIRALRDPSAKVKGNAVDSVKQLGAEGKCRKTLERLRDSDPDEEVRVKADLALSGQWMF